ncbi:Na/Pi cotransporter family protein [Rhodoblastus sp.]|jgi:phosphate:Na+ symporter|uniref:Na/Pi cotransporter family protein n=1 Tax=Rhodoblastus sp. TaxID=1962975 RepID=UPI0025F17374|nr:Na/Pi cotransporter family protein [Rhodoblastus sp.]
MTFPLNLLSLCGAVALLLWGSHMVQTGIQRAFGPRLGAFLASALHGRLQAFLAGVGVTALLQSSTATGLMATGFAAAGMVDLVPALAVMLGANVGTTLVAQFLTFNVTAFAPTFILLGVILFRRDSGAARDVGRAFIGLGLMFLALSQLLDLMMVYEDTPSLRMLLGAIATEPLVDVLVAAGLTWAAHSSVAVVLFVMSLAARGAVPPDAAFALVLGANIGAAINPVLEGPAGDDPVAKRLPLGNLITRVAGAAVALAFLAPIGRFMVTAFPDNGRAVVNFHTLFNLVVAAAFFPILPYYASLLKRLLPRREDPADPANPIYLDAAARETPIIALGGAGREALRLVDLVQETIGATRLAVEKGDRRAAVEARRRDDLIDRLAGAIKGYLVSLDPEALSAADQRRMGEIATFVSEIEQAGDALSRGFLAALAKQLKDAIGLDPADRDEVLRMIDRLDGNLRTAGSLFMTEDPRVAHLLADEKIAFRDAESQAALAHLNAIGSGSAALARASAFRLELMRDLKQINGHIVAASAYPLLERTGELLPSRHLARKR